MAQQVTIQPPHDVKASMEYGKGGRFRSSLGVASGILIALLMIFVVLWILTQVLD